MLDELSWPSPGILGEKVDAPPRLATLRRSISRAVSLARSRDRYPTHHPGQGYACGFEAWQAWIDGLRDDARFRGRAVSELVVPIQANAWCYQSLVDARAAAARYLRSFVSELEAPAAAEALERAAGLYQAAVDILSVATAQIPNPQVDSSEDHVALRYRLKSGEPWSAEARGIQIDALERAFELERQAVEAIEQSSLVH